MGAPALALDGRAGPSSRSGRTGRTAASITSTDATPTAAGRCSASGRRALAARSTTTAATSTSTRTTRATGAAGCGRTAFSRRNRSGSSATASTRTARGRPERHPLPRDRDRPGRRSRRDVGGVGPRPVQRSPRGAGERTPARALRRPRPERLQSSLGMSLCPRCGKPLEAEAKVCRHCLQIVDREAWQEHDAGRLGADDRGGGQPLEDPPVGPIPLTGGGMAWGAVGSTVKLLGASLLALPRRRGSIAESTAPLTPGPAPSHPAGDPRHPGCGTAARSREESGEGRT